MLESGISNSDKLKVTWPFDFGSTSVSAVSTSDSYLSAADGTKILFSASGSTNVIYITPKSALAAGEWYKLTLMTGGSPVAKLYKNPVSLMTISANDADAVVYDENPSAGLLTIVPAAATVADV